MDHIPWPSIESFAHVYKSVEVYGTRVGPTSIAHKKSIEYKAKIKLHGTNAGILINNNEKIVLPQSRSKIISISNDNMNFASWVEETKQYWLNLGNILDNDGQVVIFGEWCGKGIQKNVAISNIDHKIFAIFAIQIGSNQIIFEPDMISLALSIPSVSIPKNVHVLPWFVSSENKDVIININYLDKNSIKKEIEKIENLINNIDICDPWVKKVFNIEGHGEGLVWYPVNLSDENGNIERHFLSQYMFKTKGEKHKIVKTKKLIPIDPEKAKNINDYVNMFVTEDRLEQGVREINNGQFVFDYKLIGPFIGWISKDIKKEGEEELIASNLEWKSVTKEIAQKARNWYLQKLKEI